ncbi:AraC family transcriptional regulator [Bacillus sp. NP157]|nr:AraC family transcriptional regulator [Bacillus sp. NP157]
MASRADGSHPALALARHDALLDELGSILAGCMRLPKVDATVLACMVSAIVARLTELGHTDDMSSRPGVALQPWQEALATALLGNPGPCVPIPAVASACGTTVGNFCRAFRAKFGCTPQEWRVDARLAHAKTLMLQTSLSLTHIALECGFAEQSHFNHSFLRRVGSSPGAWRRRERGVE